MPRAPNEKIEKAKELYLNGVKLVEIASQLEIPPGTVRRWKSTHNWDSERSDKKANVRKNKKGAQLGNKNATGGPAGNKKAERHGFFAKWLPAETMEIMQCIERSNPIDLLWDNIQLQYAAIIRGQRLWYVKNQEDITTTKIAESDSQFGSSEKWEAQQAWDKHSSFIQAQSRAMKTLESMIKQYDELTRSELATEEQRARVDKLKSEVSRLNGDSDGQLDKLLEAVKDVH